jgi:hypothetical protein
MVGSGASSTMRLYNSRKKYGPQRSEGQSANANGSKLGNEPPICALIFVSFAALTTVYRNLG